MTDGAFPLDLPDDDAVLREIAAMDLALARRHFAAAMAEDDPQISAELGRAYQRVARSLRQSIALRARLAQDAENHRIAHTPVFGGDAVLDAFRRPAQPSAAAPQPPAEDPRVRTRKIQLRCALQTTIWSERETGELDRAAAARLRDRVDEHLWRLRHPADFADRPLDTHVADLCEDLGLTYDPHWPDRPAPPDFWANPSLDAPDDREDAPAGAPALRRSSA